MIRKIAVTHLVNYTTIGKPPIRILLMGNYQSLGHQNLEVISKVFTQCLAFHLLTSATSTIGFVCLYFTLFVNK